MRNLKKVLLYTAGPGMILVVAVALFIHIFTYRDAMSWIVGALVVFVVVFIPLYSIEYFKQNFRDEKDKNRFQFKKKKRTEWQGGNVHGRVPENTDLPGKVFGKD